MLDAYARRKQYEARLISLELMRGLAQVFGGAAGGASDSGEKWVDSDGLLARMGVTL